MAVGDRVRAGDGYTWTEEVTVAVYEPLYEADGRLRLDALGAGMIKRVGGVKGGSTGTIEGPSIKVHRTQLVGEENVPSLGGVDLVHLFPVTFDRYQRTAWIPSHHIRVTGGGHGKDIKPPF